MKTIEKIIVFIIGSIIGVGFMGYVISISNKSDIARLQKHDKCFVSLIEKNPNEVEARVEYLKECMDR